MKIVVVYDPPPIPLRNMDWIAYVDGQEEEGNYGYGKTRREAIESLLEVLDDE